MKVTKKGERGIEGYDRSKLEKRVERLSEGLDLEHLNIKRIIDKVESGSFDKVETGTLDNLLAETAAYMCIEHPDYARLAGRIKVTDLQKKTEESLREITRQLYEYKHPKTQKPAPLVSKGTYDIIQKYGEKLEEAIDFKRSLTLDFFGFKTLERSYLLKLNGKVSERIQNMFMRVAVGMHGENLERVLETYDLMSQGFMIHASPTLFNSGTPKPQCSSCFLLTMTEDSIHGIYDTLKQCAIISKSAGGIGLSVHKIRSAGSYIGGTNGISNGLVPMLRVYNDTARYVDQGGGRRKGAFAIYLEPWHSDIFEFLNLKKNTGVEETRARDLFYALWIPDLFMKRVKEDGVWSLMCPNECPGLPDVHSEKFETLYTKYEEEGKYRSQIKARELWFAILDSQIETGTPYMLYKDACNRKSNQQNLGTIRSSNLCTEIIQYTSKDEIAVCNLASIALPKYVKHDDAGKPYYDHEHLAKVVSTATYNLNRVIDVNHYPVEEARNSNMRHRPIGLGVQGLADTLIKMRFPFTSTGARKLNEDIFETIYYAACKESNRIAKIEGAYSSFKGSPMSEGKFQFNLWTESNFDESKSRYDWSSLRSSIMEHGVRNSLMLAPMPTASTSQILGNNECFEPYTSNLYTRRVLSGEFPIINKHLVKDLCKLKIWDEEMIQDILGANGSVQDIDRIPDDIKELYKTNWEIKQRGIIDMAADRGKFIDQSQSLNVFIAQPTYKKLTSMHFHAWSSGLKTGMYYLRSRPASNPIQFTVNKKKVAVEASSPQTTEQLTQPPILDDDPFSWKVNNDFQSFEPDCINCGS